MLDEGFQFALSKLADGLRPDPELILDEWSEAHVEVPKEYSSAPGKYKCATAPGARKPQQWLSPGHPCKRVVCMVASQLFKTQVGINWILGSMALAPANMLVLMPTLPLSRRLSVRVQKHIDLCEPLRGKVGESRGRGKSNNINFKEFDGGGLYITTSGAASNLAELMARYLYGEEIDRWEGDINGEGDPVKVAEARQTTFKRNRKSYFVSSPLIDGRSRIQRLYRLGTQNVPYVPCPHCKAEFLLEWECIDWDDKLSHAWAVCPHCASCIEESQKTWMLPRLRFQPTAIGDGETESLTMSVLYAPLRSISWLELAREYVDAEDQQNAGNSGPMQVFYNTRLARPWGGGKDVSTVEGLQARAEAYAEWTVPARGLVLTAGVDVQGDRLAVSVWAWGAGEECWLVYWGELYGNTLQDKAGAWKDLEEHILTRSFRHASGAQLQIRAMSVDTGDGNATQDAAYSFCRRHRRRGVMAIKGASDRGAQRKDIFTPPRPPVDTVKTQQKHKAWKYGLQPFIVGSSAAKDLLISGRLQLCDSEQSTGQGHARIHWYAGVRSDWYEQILSEVLVPSKRYRGRKVWECKSGVRNEALDTFVYAFHAARSLKINLWKPQVWEALEQRLRQSDLLAALAITASDPVEASASGAAETDAGEVPRGTSPEVTPMSAPATDGEEQAGAEESASAPAQSKPTPTPQPVNSNKPTVKRHAQRPNRGFSIKGW